MKRWEISLDLSDLSLKISKTPTIEHPFIESILLKVDLSAKLHEKNDMK